MAGAEAKNSDLPARVGSAVVMVLVAGTALWLGGWAWTAFLLAVAAGVLWEWVKLANAITPKLWARALWLVGGVGYIGVAAETLLRTREQNARGVLSVVLLIGTVVATDVGAYFAGRTIGGPKIAPKISPSKTWSGLAGGALAAGLILGGYLVYGLYHSDSPSYDDIPDWLAMVMGLIIGTVAAIIAQAGDFFESWMKRRAGVKDSGDLLPGHGGLFDRADGILAFTFAIGLLRMVLHRP